MASWPLLIVISGETVPELLDLSNKLNVQFQVGICSEKFQLDQIKTRRLSAVIKI